MRDFKKISPVVPDQRFVAYVYAFNFGNINIYIDQKLEVKNLVQQINTNTYQEVLYVSTKRTPSLHTRSSSHQPQIDGA